MAKRQSPHAKMKDFLGRLARVPKAEIDAEERCEQHEKAMKLFPPERAKPGAIVTPHKRKTG